MLPLRVPSDSSRSPRRWLRALPALGALTAACMCGAAFGQTADSGYRFYLEGGSSFKSGGKTRSASVGAQIPSALFPSLDRQAGPMTLHWDLFLSNWHAPRIAGAPRRSYTQIGGLGVWRYGFGGPDASWFADLGLGATLLDAKYAASQTRRFSTNYQFTEVLGLGYRFGPGQAYELSLRFQHFSNASVKRPNPGENFVRLRLAAQF